MPSRSFWFSLFLLLPYCALAQSPEDSVTRTRTTTLNDLKSPAEPWSLIDTSIDFIHQFNPAYQTDQSHTNLGSYGSPIFSRNFQPFARASFRTGIKGYEPYLYKPSELEFYDSYTPYTKLDYVQRTNGDLQELSGVYSRNINSFWNAAIRFNTMGTKGGYLSQLNNHNNIGLNTRFQTPNGRYRGYLSGIWNNLRVKENGGMVDVQEFKDPDTDNRSRLTINLKNAFSNYKARDYTYDHFLYLGQAQSDTIRTKQDTFEQQSIASPLQVHHQISFRERGYGYQDQNLNETDSFYPAIRKDSAFTYDSLRYTRFRNNLSIGNFRSPDSLVGPLRYRAGAAWHMLSLEQASFGADTSYQEENQRFQNILLKGRIAADIGEHQLTARAKFFPAGRYQGDFKGKGAFNLNLDSVQDLTLGYRFQRRKPAFLFRRMRSNHFQWDPTLRRTVANRAFGIYHHDTLNLTVRFNYSLTHNYTYYDQEIQPSQQEAPISSYSGEVNHQFQAGPFRWRNKLKIQAFSDPDVLRLPNWLYRSSLYYKQHFFDDNLLLTAGLDFRYTEAHQGKAYFPSYNLRYLQDQQTIAGYPVFDAHVNFKIGRFRGNLKMLHLNKGISGHDYFTIPRYPLHPRMFTIGIKWMFFD